MWYLFAFVIYYLLCCLLFLRRLYLSLVICLCCQKANTKSERKNFMKKKILCTALATVMLLSQTASAAPPWVVNRNQIVFDNAQGIRGFITHTAVCNRNRKLHKTCNEIIWHENQPRRICAYKRGLHILGMVHRPTNKAKSSNGFHIHQTGCSLCEME